MSLKTRRLLMILQTGQILSLILMKRMHTKSTKKSSMKKKQIQKTRNLRTKIQESLSMNTVLNGTKMKSEFGGSETPGKKTGLNT